MSAEKSQHPRERLIVALDFPSASEALALVDRLDGRCLWFKVGLELYLAGGRSVVDTLVQRGFKVFLDLKLHDIPNTVAGAVRSLASSGASLLTVHAAGGPQMLAAAAEAAAARSGWAQIDCCHRAHQHGHRRPRTDRSARHTRRAGRPARSPGRCRRPHRPRLLPGGGRPPARRARRVPPARGPPGSVQPALPRQTRAGSPRPPSPSAPELQCWWSGGLSPA